MKKLIKKVLKEDELEWASEVEPQFDCTLCDEILDYSVRVFIRDLEDYEVDEVGEGDEIWHTFANNFHNDDFYTEIGRIGRNWLQGNKLEFLKRTYVELNKLGENDWYGDPNMVNLFRQFQ
jgi:hypothetical protein